MHPVDPKYVSLMSKAINRLDARLAGNVQRLAIAMAIKMICSTAGYQQVPSRMLKKSLCELFQYEKQKPETFALLHF